jgi:hypothetical protein
LNFCLEDGSPLVTEPDSDPTLIAPTIPSFMGAPSPAKQPGSGSAYRLLVIAVLVLIAALAGGAAVALLYSANGWNSRNSSNRTISATSPTPKLAKTSESPTAQATPQVPDLSGDWNLVNTIEKTSFPSYANLRLGYHLSIQQNGTEFTAEGEKNAENGVTMDKSERTAIHVSGSVRYDNVSATFVEEGMRRKTSGRFEWKLSSAGNQLRGVFFSTAANSSGSSVATRE